MKYVYLAPLAIFVLAGTLRADVVSATPDNINFGSQVLTTTSGALSVVLSNPTKKDLQIFGVTITGDFSIVFNSCGPVLAAGFGCGMSVAFAPTAAGSRTGLLSINDDSNDTPHKVKLSGTGVPVQMTSITVAPANPTVPAGLTQQLTATGNFNTGATQDLTGSVTWTSSVTAVATIAPGGLVTGIRQGTSTITATSSVATATGPLSGSTVLTVGPPVLQSLTITNPAFNGVIAQGMTLQLTARGTFSDNTIQDVTGSVQWNSSNYGLPPSPLLATVSATGLVTGKTPGLANITASFGSLNVGIGIQVTAPALTSITVTPANASIAVGTSLQFAAIGTLTDGSIQDITNAAQWSSTVAASISASGVATGSILGIATITASGRGFNNVGIIGQTILEVGNAFDAVPSQMSAVRFFHTATSINGGRLVLLAGGATSVSGSPLSSVEFYDPVANTFNSGGAMISPRARHTATLLANGKVLLAAGLGAGTSAEIYDPAAQSFSPTGNMFTSRSDHTATLLPSGQVLVAGGYTASAELYDPATGVFTPTGSMAASRRGHTATPLGNGKVLIAGGVDGSGISLASAELYDPATGLFSSAGAMTAARAFHRATLLNGGKILLTGGFLNFNSWIAQAELYDPATGLFTAAGSMNVARDSHTATLLNNGQVLIVGGEGAAGVVSTTERYDPTSGTFSLTATTNNVHFDPTRIGHTTTLLYNGRTLVAGGSLGTGAGVYEPRILTPPGMLSVTVAPASASIAAGTSQRFVATGAFQDGTTLTLPAVFWFSTSSAVATVSNDVGSSGIAMGLATGTASIEASSGLFGPSGVASVTVP